MERNRLLRRPLIWIILVVGAAILLSYVLNGSPSYTQAKTSDVQTILTQDANLIQKVTIQDKEQTVELDLSSKVPLPSDKSTTADKIQAQFPALAMDDIFKQVMAAQQSGSLAKSATVNTTVTKDSVLLSVLFNFLPIVALVIILLFFMSQAQGGGSRVLNFGKSKAKLIS